MAWGVFGLGSLIPNIMSWLGVSVPCRACPGKDRLLPRFTRIGKALQKPAVHPQPGTVLPHWQYCGKLDPRLLTSRAMGSASDVQTRQLNLFHSDQRFCPKNKRSLWLPAARGVSCLILFYGSPWYCCRSSMLRGGAHTRFIKCIICLLLMHTNLTQFHLQSGSVSVSLIVILFALTATIFVSKMKWPGAF